MKLMKSGHQHVVQAEGFPVRFPTTHMPSATPESVSGQSVPYRDKRVPTFYSSMFSIRLVSPQNVLPT
eukprot:126195-Chlamydomonas_euryale.AAC.10